MNRTDRQAMNRKFPQLVKEWKESRPISSRSEDFAREPAYQEIIGMGTDAIQYIFEEQERSLDHWFWALRSITRANPVLDDHRGNLKLMAEDWKQWQQANRRFKRDAEIEFEPLAETWREETGFLSNITTICMNPNYQMIMGLGKPVIPLMLNDLKKRLDASWNWALFFLSGRTIIEFDSKYNGNVKKMSEAWIDWGIKEKLI